MDPGTVLKGRYRLERLLGRGGMAAVWLATDAVLERQVAVKVLSDTIATDPGFLARFRREARVAAGVSHPNLVEVFDYADGAERPYLVMEYVAGPNLAERLRQGAPIDCERLARELLGALVRIHAAGIVHRDVKAQNVLLAPDRSAKLIDFGIALPADATALTQTGHLLGTARYLAPEVLRGEPATPASDLFACGVLLRECIGEDGAGPLSALVERLASPNPRARPASAEAALARLNRPALIPDEPTRRLEMERALPPPLEPVRGSGRRWPGAVALAGAVGLAALVLAMAVGGSSGGEGARRGSKPAGGGSAAQAQNAGQAQTATTASASPEPETEQEAETDGEDTAPPEASTAAEADTERGIALNAEGFEMIQAGAPEEAVPLLEEAVASFPDASEDLDYAYALFNLGNALRLSGRAEEAIPVLERRLAIPNQTAVVREELEAAEREAG
jgi:predicted Ser/Thr protein kinase